MLKLEGLSNSIINQRAISAENGDLYVHDPTKNGALPEVVSDFVIFDPWFDDWNA